MQFALTDGIEIRGRTPAVLRALIAGLSDGWIRCDEGPGTFNAFDSVGHLVHGERIDWILRARIILAQGATRRFEPYDRLASMRESAGKTLAQLLDEFTQLRGDKLRTLESWQLSEEQLLRTGLHPELGPVTLRQLLAAWAGQAWVTSRSSRACSRSDNVKRSAHDARICPSWTDSEPAGRANRRRAINRVSIPLPI